MSERTALLPDLLDTATTALTLGEHGHYSSALSALAYVEPEEVYTAVMARIVAAADGAPVWPSVDVFGYEGVADVVHAIRARDVGTVMLLCGSHRAVLLPRLLAIAAAFR